MLNLGDTAPLSDKTKGATLQSFFEHKYHEILGENRGNNSLVGWEC